MTDPPIDKLGSHSARVLEYMKDSNGITIAEESTELRQAREEAQSIIRAGKIPNEETIEKIAKLTKKGEERKDKLSAEDQTMIAAQLAQNTGWIAAATSFHKKHPFIYDKNKIWYLWNKERCVYEQVDETDMLNIVRKALNQFGDATVKRRSELLEALRQVGREYEPQPLPLHWIQFGTLIFDIETQTNIESTPNFFTVNAIPWDRGTISDTPIIDKLFTEWVGVEDVQTLYEIIAYCTYRDYPIHSVFVLNGCGRNGKGKFLGLLQKFLGEKNCAATDLERLTENSFETFNLYQKLIGVMGETNFSILTKTSKIKQLSGQDLVPFEKKGVTSFSGYNYAKLIMATNSLPSSDDTSEGFYRRWFIKDFTNEFTEGKNILATIPDHEYRALANKVTTILPQLLANEQFTHQGTITQRRQKYIEASNPLSIFLEQYLVRTNNENDYLRHNSVYTKYIQWLTVKKRRKVKIKEFNQSLEDEGIEHRRTTITLPNGMKENGTFIFGLRYKQTISEFEAYSSQEGNMQEMSNMQTFSLDPIRVRTESELLHNEHIAHTAPINAVQELMTSKAERLRVWFDRQPVRPVPIEEVEKAWPEWAQLKEAGELFEPRAGFLEVLR